MNRCFLEINLNGFSENASLRRLFFKKTAISASRVRGRIEKRDFLSVSTGKMRFLGYL